jgi:hypothetical protein
MKSLADGLPPDLARQVHTDWRKNEAAYWAIRDQLLDQYRGHWIAFADGKVVGAGERPVIVSHAAKGLALHAFVTCVGYEDQLHRMRGPQRVSRPLTEAEQKRLAEQRAAIAAELNDLTSRDQMRKEAREEPTLSAEMRRAIHASDKSLSTIAVQAGMTPLQLDEFLTGERTLRSDVIDRLAQVLGYELKITAIA